jgi:glycogen(starch) synthase
VGGIYTVIKTKASVTCLEYGSRYCLIGPYSHKTASMEVEETEPPTEALKEAIASIARTGIKCVVSYL